MRKAIKKTRKESAIHHRPLLQLADQTKGVRMSKAAKLAARRFSDSLRELVRYTYCVGAATEAETRKATQEYLLDLAFVIGKKVPIDTICPTKR